MEAAAPKQLTSYHNPITGYKWRLETVQTQPHDLAPRTVKVIEHPGVYLVGYTALHEGYVNEFLNDHQITTFTPWGYSDDPDEHGGRNTRGSDDELMIELAGRICYMSYERPRPGGVETFIERLKSEGHGSVFEHPHYNFIVSGVSRNLTLEANRHRPFSISQLSGRFVDASEVGFVADPDIIENGYLRNEWAAKCLTAFDHYEKSYERNFERQLRKWSDKLGAKTPNLAVPSKEIERKLIKKARERARDILPGCLETRVLYTVNARAIRLIFEKRCHPDAAFEIRRCFNGLFRILQKHDPKIFSDYAETELDDGTFAVATKYNKI